MFDVFRNLKLKYKILGGFALVLFLAAVMAAVAGTGIMNTQQDIDDFFEVIGKIGDLNTQSQYTMLQARRDEKDYLLRYREVGFEEARAEYVAGVQAQVALVKRNMAAAKRLAPADFRIADSTDAVVEAINTYELTFIQMVQFLEQKGYKDVGLEGEFRDKVHQIEAVVTGKNLDNLMVDMLVIRRHEKDYLLRADGKYVDKVHKAVAQLQADTAAADLSQSEKDEIAALAGEYRTLFDRLVALDDQIAAETQIFREAAHKVEALLQTINATVVQRMQADQTAMLVAVQQTRSLIIGTAIAMLALGIAVAFLLTRAITGPVIAVAQAIRGIATGDLEQHITLDTRDELGDMVRAFSTMTAYLRDMAAAADDIAHGNLTNTITPRSEEDVLGQSFAQMSRNLQQLVKNVLHSINSLHSAAGELDSVSRGAGQAANNTVEVTLQVAQSASKEHEQIERSSAIIRQVSFAVEGVAQGAQEQAHALEKSMRFSEQISTAMEQVAQTATAGAKSATTAAQVAHDGTQIIETTITGMQSIKDQVEISAMRVREMGERSNEIGIILETIEDIASQTNLLALNAAIEAARAGEHGKGFAVVADEVRKLAEKSAGATGEIGNLVKTIQQTVAEAVAAMEHGQQEVETGVSHAHQSQQALNGILTNVEDVQQQVAHIAAASQEINASSSELVDAMSSVSSVVEENTAAAEEMSAGAAEALEVTETVAQLSLQSGQVVQSATVAANRIVDEMSRVTAAVETLNAVANELTQRIDQFALAEDNDSMPAQETEEAPLPELA